MLSPYYYIDKIEAGCDEAGRGCLAGSVYAAAVILPKDYRNDLLNDSKQLTAHQRYMLRETIEHDAIAWAVGVVTAQEIDKMNILRASITAMHRAIDRLSVRPEALIIDGNPITTYTLNDYFSGEFGDYTYGHVAFSIPRLEAGEHQLVFRAWDLLNNPNSTTLNFVVDPELPLNILKIYAANNPARSQTQFLVSYDRPGSVCEFTVEVFDFTGRLLWSHAETGSNDTGFYAIPWNLTTGSGFPLGSGIYLYRARVKCDNSEEATASQKLIVNRRQ